LTALSYELVSHETGGRKRLCLFVSALHLSFLWWIRVRGQFTILNKNGAVCVWHPKTTGEAR